MATDKSKLIRPSRRDVLKYSAAGTALLSTPFVSRAWAQATDINMLAWFVNYLGREAERAARIAPGAGAARLGQALAGERLLQR